MGKKNWIYTLRKEELSEECRELGLPADGTVETMRSSLARWVDDSKEEEVLALTHGLEEMFGQRSTPRQRAASGTEKFIESLVVPDPRMGRSKEPQSREYVPAPVGYAKVARQVRDWSFRFDGTGDPLEFLDRVTWSAKTYGLDINTIPRAMPELLQGRAQRMFIMNDEEWPTWARFKASFENFFLPKGYFEKLADQVRQRKQRRGEPFKEYMVDLQSLMKPLGKTTKEVIERLVENCMPRMKMFIRPYACASLEEVMGLAEEFEELAQEEEAVNRPVATEQGWCHSQPADPESRDR
ncbi:hypothetical protein KR074_003958, partial [Drosophila pseudoananassae]